MNRKIVLGILLALVLVAGAISLGVYAYNLGVAQGLAESARLSDLPPGAEMKPYPIMGGHSGSIAPLVSLAVLGHFSSSSSSSSCSRACGGAAGGAMALVGGTVIGIRAFPRRLKNGIARPMARRGGRPHPL
jgi:hypothetical protein